MGKQRDQIRHWAERIRRRRNLPGGPQQYRSPCQVRRWARRHGVELDNEGIRQAIATGCPWRAGTRCGSTSIGQAAVLDAPAPQPEPVEEEQAAK